MYQNGVPKMEYQIGVRVLFSYEIYSKVYQDSPELFQIVGGVILGVGIWSLVDDNALKLMHVASVDSDDDLIRGAAITFVVIGAIVFVTGFLGCCGAMRESSCMLMMVRNYVPLH